jgi:hypothetical protein
MLNEDRYRPALVAVAVSESPQPTARIDMQARQMSVVGWA